MNIDYNLLSILIATTAVLITLTAVVIEHYRTNYIHGIDLLLKFEDQFHSEEFRKIRKVAAGILLKAIGNMSETSGFKSNILELDELLDFFQMVGVLTHKRVLDKELVWNSFYYYLNYYYLGGGGYISYNRKNAPAIWEEVEWLFQEFRKIEKKHRLPLITDLSKLAIKKFLSEEHSSSKNIS
jgi:hypothetical protein